MQVVPAGLSATSTCSRSSLVRLRCAQAVVVEEVRERENGAGIDFDSCEDMRDSAVGTIRSMERNRGSAQPSPGPEVTVPGSTRLAPRLGW